MSSLSSPRLQILIWPRFMTYCANTLCVYITAHGKITKAKFALKRRTGGISPALNQLADNQNMGERLNVHR